MVGLAIPCLPAMHHHDTARSQALPSAYAAVGGGHIVSLLHGEDTMVTRLCHAAHYLPLSSHEAWDNSGSMRFGYGHNTDLSQPTPHSQDPTFRLRPQAMRAINLRVMLHNMRVGTGQVLHMPG